ncbi:type VI secretion system contractile sheath large subunit [Jiella sp. MQZ9-1]|uniref:Type VI secretion system contractile sheath large subunit n=1 Tax=Jiella flava TaxID=2816857 RepID=A0A939JTZ9_9HYPH|nr:type VI secretion system contractile sheath large subunit [Jiella flava]MBO0662660.1 type VI secretion system contractile sheath large subunit [Jiella flava]MCD2471082.1 type VI secretion system contractile sheath large subunit [Jiella flava]
MRGDPSDWIFRTVCDRVIAKIDAALERQVNAIIHHPQFQEMEARWRGLALLVRTAARSEDVKIKVVSVSWRDLGRSLERAGEFDQSALFDLVYNREFGAPGGEPFGLLVGDYLLSPTPRGTGDTVGALQAIGGVAAAAFSPFVAGAAPEALGLAEFSDLNRTFDLSLTDRDPGLVRWLSMRSDEDSRFLGLVAPRILFRAPYTPYERCRDDGFPFQETIASDGSTLLWGNGAFAFAAIVIRAFIDTGWFADLRGVTQDRVDGGMLGPSELLPLDLGIESAGLSEQPPVEVRLTVQQQQQMADKGLIPIGTTYLSPALIFNSNQSLHSPGRYSSESARQNARLAAMLQYVLCASRFSHYLKVIMRDEIGALSDASIIERRLADWLAEYTLGNDDASQELRTRYPLRSAGIEVGEIPGKPGSFACTVRLQPHFQLDDVTTSFHLVAESPGLAGETRDRGPAVPERVFA